MVVQGLVAAGDVAGGRLLQGPVGRALLGEEEGNIKIALYSYRWLDKEQSEVSY